VTFTNATRLSASPAELVIFAHTALFSPSLLTPLCITLDLTHVTGFPGLTSKLVCKYPPQLIATTTWTSHKNTSAPLNTKGKQTTYQRNGHRHFPQTRSIRQTHPSGLHCSHPPQTKREDIFRPKRPLHHSLEYGLHATFYLIQLQLRSVHCIRARPLFDHFPLSCPYRRLD
jgi:hypothetical protein